jgi:hypothetical protein
LLIIFACVLAIALQLSIDKMSFEVIVGLLAVSGFSVVFSGLLMRFFIEKAK